ncbi:PTS sugar transporter subunit IIA [Mesorhizobium sp. M0965]|uniref:PTS sugar transporter subunit IIA n=1 Tax=Mesorhizobium sp. M0965 TaxID=2957036 RepID=UPI0033384B34
MRCTPFAIAFGIHIEVTLTVCPILSEEDISLDLATKGKQSALSKIAIRIARRAGLDEQVVLRGLFDREDFGSTGIGRGVAIPHVLLGMISSPVASLTAWPSLSISTAGLRGGLTHLRVPFLRGNPNRMSASSLLRGRAALRQRAVWSPRVLRSISPASLSVGWPACALSSRVRLVPQQSTGTRP